MNIIQIYKRFPTEKDCVEYLEHVRWNGIPQCPYCNSRRTTSLPKESRHHCNRCNTSFAVTVGTIFHNTKLDLQKWFLALVLILNAKQDISARQLGRDLEVTKDTAWRMSLKIRDALTQKQSELLSGVVEMDETYIGGKPRKGKKYDDDDKLIRGRGTKKVSVFGRRE